MEGLHGIHGWQWLFILSVCRLSCAPYSDPPLTMLGFWPFSEGSATVGVAAICAFLLPEYPHNARMLSPIERDLAVWRIEKESGAAEGTEEVTVLQGFVLALKDVKLWMLIGMNMLSQVRLSWPFSCLIFWSDLHISLFLPSVPRIHRQLLPHDRSGS
jgi:hypothetical protein